MFKKILYLSICLITFTGCSKKTKNIVEVCTIKVNINRNDNPSEINKYLRFSHYVPLQTDQNILIGEINKIQIINDKIYILDWKQAVLFIFEPDGNFVSKIARKGRGPEEYLYVSDFEVTADGSIFLNDPVQGRIYVYDELGNFKYRMENIPKTWSFKFLADGKIACNSANGGSSTPKGELFNYTCVSDRGEVIYEGLPFNKALIGQKFFNGSYTSLFYQYNDNIYMSSMLSDTVYRVSGATGEIFPHVAFDFNVLRPVAKDTPNNVTKYLESRNTEFPTSPYNYCFFNNGIIAFYDYEFKSHILITDSDGKLLYSALTPADENGIKLSYITPYIDSNNSSQIINTVVPTRIFSWINERKNNNDEHKLLDEIGSHVNENSNPILFFYDWIYK